jgi:hypothetical protein
MSYFFFHWLFYSYSVYGLFSYRYNEDAECIEGKSLAYPCITSYGLFSFLSLTNLLICSCRPNLFIRRTLEGHKTRRSPLAIVELQIKFTFHNVSLKNNEGNVIRKIQFMTKIHIKIRDCNYPLEDFHSMKLHIKFQFELHREKKNQSLLKRLISQCCIGKYSVSTLCKQYGELLIFRAAGTYTDDWVYKRLMGVYVTEMCMAITWNYGGTCLCRRIYMRELSTLKIIRS